MKSLLLKPQSQNVKSAEYFPMERRLIIQFPTSAYEYADVPETVWDILCEPEKQHHALSTGQLVNLLVVRGSFTYRRLAEYKPEPDAEVIGTGAPVCPYCGGSAVVAGACSSCGYGIQPNPRTFRPGRLAAARSRRGR